MCQAVAASSASDVWLFAASADGGSPRAMRWNGSRWVTIPLPGGSFYPDEAVVLSTDRRLGRRPPAAMHRQRGHL